MLTDGTVETWYRGTDSAPDIQTVDATDATHVYGLSRSPQLALVRYSFRDGEVAHVLDLTSREIGTPDVGRRWNDLVIDDRALYWGTIEEECIERYIPPVNSAAPP